MDKSNQVLKIITAIAVVLAAVLGIIFLLRNGIKPVSNIETNKLSEEISKGPIAQAELSIPASPGSENVLSIYKVRAEGGKFSITNIKAKKGDNINISITAVDRGYDFSIPTLGIKQVINKGETKPAIFQVMDPGVYKFYCEVCGGAESQARGSIIVNP